jgi:hypothetical protein
LMALVDDPKPGTWYLFSNRTRSLLKCGRFFKGPVPKY